MEREKSLKNTLDVSKLIDIIVTLRGKNGCPWDQKQTPKSMIIYLIEEVYELYDAILSGNTNDIIEEIGDVLFQILFIVNLFMEKKSFDINDIVKVNVEKMIRRHPHVFGDKTLDNAEDVKIQWEKIKLNEKKSDHAKSLLDSIPSSLPALIKAYRISDRVGRAGFDWDNISEVIKKVEEEWFEFMAELKKENKQNISLEFGDILFTLVNIARFAKIHPETALADSTNKFEKRYKYMETKALDNWDSIQSVPRDELEMLWDKAKKTVDKTD